VGRRLAEFVALGDHLAAGMGSSLGARGVVPEDHPHYFHIFDMQASMMAVRNEADVVLVVGARLGEYDGWGMPPAWGDPARQRTIQIDVDPLSIGLNRPVDVAIVADARAALAALLAAVQVQAAGPRDHAWSGPLPRAVGGDAARGHGLYGCQQRPRRQPGADGDDGRSVLRPATR
jgi:thiamine pyrophosphate-dependent acetolactate synthase large subunit-like protein